VSEDLIMTLSILDELLLDTIRHGDGTLGVVDAGEVDTSHTEREVIAREVDLGDVLAVLTDASLSVVLEDLLIAVLTVKRDDDGTSLETEVKVLLKLLAVNEGVADDVALIGSELLLEALAHVLLEPLIQTCVGLLHFCFSVFFRYQQQNYTKKNKGVKCLTKKEKRPRNLQ